MKRLHIAGNLSKSLLFAGLLAACSSEQMVTPNEPANITLDDNNAKIAAFIPQLLKEGNKELKYYDSDVNRGKLWKVIDLMKGEYTEYIYGPQSITAQHRKISTNNLIYQVTYQLDAIGRCVESLSTYTNKTLKYEYGQLGRLAKVYNKDDADERMEFSYQADYITLLKTVLFFDKYNTQTKEVNYNYSVPGGNAMENKYPTNPGVLGETSEYLPYFGSFHSYLVTLKSEKSLPWNGAPIPSSAYSYSFNAQGYAKTISIKDGLTNFIETKTRTYTAPKL